MKTAKLFRKRQTQTIRLPKELYFEGKEVFIKKVRNATILLPTKDSWAPLIYSPNKFSKDYMKTRNQPKQQEREDIFS
jgi:antitoxin VapB